MNMLTAGKNSNANRMYSTNKEGCHPTPALDGKADVAVHQNSNATGSSSGQTQATGPAQPKVTSQKSPGKSFKHGRNTQSAT